MKKIISLHKKIVFALASIVSIIGYGYFVYAAVPTPPPGGYLPGDVLDPNCAPGDTDCIVALTSSGSISIGDLIGNSDPNSILYTNSDGELTIDNLFTRDSATKETYIGKDFTINTSEQTVTAVNVLGISNLSNSFTIGEQVTGSMSGSTGIVENIIGGILYLSNVSSGFVDGETLTGSTSGETATINDDFPVTQFSVNDSFVLLDPNTMTQTGAGIIASVIGTNQYTVSLFSGTLNQNDLMVDNIGNNFSKIAAIANVSSAPSQQIANSGGFQVGSLLGGLLQGVGSSYRSQDNSKFALSFVGSGLNGGNAYSAVSIVGDLVANKFSTISQDLYGPTGSPLVQISSSDALGGYNSTILLDRHKLTLHNNRGIYLLADDGIYMGRFDYNSQGNPLDPFPLFPDYYILPTVRGAAGQVLTDDGNGNVTWQSPGGGSSPISLNGTTLYSSGLSGAGDHDNNNIFFGSNAGYVATGVSYSNFLGLQAGSSATNASYSNFIGINAGNGAIDATYSNFLGSSAGVNATNASDSNFFGRSAGENAANAANSNFFGINTGAGATEATNSNFLGASAGYGATNASDSNFFGQNAGHSAVNANNSIFIGNLSGYGDIVNNTVNADDYSILIGPNTSTGNNGSNVGYSNSIAIGAYATNTASNQFMIGSATRPIDEIRVVQTGGTECIIDTSGLGCTSDERLKTNITDLTTDTLDKVLNVKTVTYNWLNNPDGKTMTGFLAQDLEQYFPELVATNERGQKSVYYAQMTPILVQAIREMNLKITTINDMETPNTWRDSLITWFGNVENGIVKFFAGEIETKNLCITDDAGEKTCITKTQLDQLLNGSGVSASPSPEQVSDPEPESDTGTTSDVSDNESPVGDNESVSTDEIPSDPVVSGDVSAPSTETPAESPVEAPSGTPSETSGSNDESASTGEPATESGSI